MGENPLAKLGNLLILDRMNEPAGDALQSFALDELLCRRTGEGGPGICHLWRHPRAFILGLRDSRLPGAADARRWLETQGYDVAVRHSGGAAVPLDTGVVNVSLILPHAAGAAAGGGDADGAAPPGGPAFREDFERMYALVREALAGLGRRVDKGEIAGAYCPGDYDLSIGGYKFCGIAQRRQTRAYVVQAFVVAEGSGSRRARLVREFYDRAAYADTDPAAYPLVTDDSTASLGELAGIGTGAAAIFAEEIKRVVRGLQTPEGMEAAAAGLRMPSAEQTLEMARTLRARYPLSTKREVEER